VCIYDADGNMVAMMGNADYQVIRQEFGGAKKVEKSC
jgi:hypothetical protein